MKKDDIFQYSVIIWALLWFCFYLGYAPTIAFIIQVGGLVVLYWVARIIYPEPEFTTVNKQESNKKEEGAAMAPSPMP